MKLSDTAEYMNSPDYRVRFQAEYLQLKIRCEKLNNFIHKIEAYDLVGGVKPEHDCPLYLLKDQLRCMREYMNILELRAAIEKVSLNEVE